MIRLAVTGGILSRPGLESVAARSGTLKSPPKRLREVRNGFRGFETSSGASGTVSGASETTSGGSGTVSGASKRLPERPERFPEPPKRLREVPERFPGPPERLSEHPERFSEHPERLWERPERFSEHPKRLWEHPERFSERPERFSEHPERLWKRPEPFPRLRKDFGSVRNGFRSSGSTSGRPERFPASRCRCYPSPISSREPTTTTFSARRFKRATEEIASTRLRTASGRGPKRRASWRKRTCRMPSLLPTCSCWFSNRSTQFIAMTSTSLSSSWARRTSYSTASSRVNSK